MSNLPTGGKTKNATKPANNPPEPSHLESSANYKEPYSKRLKRYCNRNFQKTPIWIEAACGLALVGITFAYTHYAGGQLEEMKKTTESTRQLVAVTQKQLELSERPWVKFKPRILTMAFSSKFFRVESAAVTIEDTFENVGPTVALNVAAWEDVFPLDATFYRTAMARQKELCDIARHPDPNGVTGYFLFPKDPFVNHSIVGPPMNLVTQAVMKTPQGDRVGFVLVGCVSYRAPFEAIDAPRHQTRYVYLLGRIGADGLFNTGIEPTGTAIGLEVAALPDGLSAD